jgi:hypothetical protein
MPRLAIDYQPVNIPLTKPSGEASDREQEAYYQWFVDAIPYRIDQLTKLVSATPKFEGWPPK